MDRMESPAKIPLSESNRIISLDFLHGFALFEKPVNEYSELFNDRGRLL